MGNSNLIASMQHILDDYEAGHITPEQVKNALDFHMQGLEGIGLSSIHKIRTFTYRLVNAHLSDGEIEFKDDERVATVLSELRSFVNSLPKQ